MCNRFQQGAANVVFGVLFVCACSLPAVSVFWVVFTGSNLAATGEQQERGSPRGRWRGRGHSKQDVVRGVTLGVGHRDSAGERRS